MNELNMTSASSTITAHALTRGDFSNSSFEFLDNFSFFSSPFLDFNTLPLASREKIKTLKNNFTVIGIAGATKIADETIVPIYLTSESVNANGHTFQKMTAYDLNNRDCVGFATLIEDENIASKSCAEFEGPFISIEQINNQKNQDYKHVGAALFKAIVQVYGSQARYNYRIRLLSLGTNAPFYYKLGCRVSQHWDLGKQKKIESEIEIAAQSIFRSTKDWGPIYMTLSNLGKEHWKNNITTYPICFPDDV